MSSRPLVELLRTALAPPAARWLDEALAAVAPGAAGPAAEILHVRWSGAGRRLGKDPLTLEPAHVAGLRAAGAPFIPQGWGADELGRALLLMTGLEGSPPEQHPELVGGLYRTGEIRERQAVLRVLAYLPDPDRFTTLAVEAVRANVLTEIEAIACDNPFPGRYFPEAAFNQMVLKCLFNGIPLGRVEALPQRRGAELRRMVAAYASERQAAGRPVPPDSALVLDGGSDAPL